MFPFAIPPAAPQSMPEALERVPRAGGSPNPTLSASEIREIARKVVAGNPGLARTVVQVKDQPHTTFDAAQNRVNIGARSRRPERELAYAMGHMQNQADSPLYQKLLILSKGLTDTARSAAGPTMLALKTLVDDQNQRRDIMRVLAALSAAAAAPQALENMMAAGNAAAMSPNPAQYGMFGLGQAAKETLPSGLPALLFQLGQRI